MTRLLTAAELERISRYRKLETEALRAAAACKNIETRDAYITIAAAWAKLIAGIEHTAEHDDDYHVDFLPPPERQHTGKPLTK